MLLAHPAAVHHRHGCQTARCDRHIDRWLQRWREAHAPMSTAEASWYYDEGGTACGVHYTLGFASRTLPCGSSLTMCHEGNCVVARVEDRGPFIYSRLFDLNPALRSALGCPDTCTVSFR